MGRVYSIAYRVVGNKEDAEDIAQDVFLKVYHGLKTFEQQASFSTWLYRIATNSALDHLEKMRRRRQANSWFFSHLQRNDRAGDEEVTKMQATPDAAPETQVIQRELRECIQGVLKTLDREQARLLILRDYDDRSYDEIAQMLQAGLSAVKMRIHRARLAFQQLFSELCGSFPVLFPGPTGNTQNEAPMPKE
jgi:RNA polymerase sigma-70 factor (ECF subfamily)